MEIKKSIFTDLVPIKNDFLAKIKYFKDGIGIQFSYTYLVSVQISYTTNIVNVYIVYDLDNWPKNLLRKFTPKNCLFEVTNIVRNSDKEKCVYSGYGITFDGRGEWSFNKYTTRNVIFGFDNSSSPHTDNLKNDFLILGEGPTFGINGSFGVSKNVLILILLEQKQRFVLVCIIMLIIVTHL